MLRALVLIAAILVFRTFLPRNSRRSPTAPSPYMNSLDGLMSAAQISAALEEIEATTGRSQRNAVPARSAVQP